ncbi:hypothetical protein NQ314_013546 [Rhamnusium bicolor]|uniref:Nuclear cap-binding protein subunit 3 n=1 Tax=Rhamnusium bicolor TaxID=1586634 RepID=A0AAV8X6E7_9CUCU|nr:hypothetical protein NQ314_013546 [Rhamnusium bicolor]
MASEVEMEKMRPNIRIEIHNNLTENDKMDVDESLKSDNEEGEIIEDNDASENKMVLSKSTPDVTNRIWPNMKGIFTTGINIFDKEEQEKLQERARRFSLKPDEIHNFTDADLEELHDSLGITADNEDNVRFDAVHILGTEKMSTEDVLEYFMKYAPTGIEWISDDSCNVIWSEHVSAARAMFYISKVVQGMPAREPCDPFAKEFLDIEELEEGTGRSILLKNKNREVELKVDNEILPSRHSFKNAVDISEITIPIPPGYWRLGEKHPKAKCLLVRFAFKTDKKPYKAEKFSKYYKKYGNSKAVISESKKKELRGIFERNRELNHDKNPWGSLAKNWDHDAKFRERVPELIVEPKIEIKNPSILVRLGTKRKQEQTEHEQEEVVVNLEDEEEEETGEKERKKTIKRQTEKLSKEDYLNRRDLRNVLGITNRRAHKEEIIESDPEIVDLGTKLRNRTKNMVFTVERDLGDIETYDRKENVRSDIRSLIEERRARSPVLRRRISPPHWSPERRRPPEYRRRSPVRRRRSPLRSSPLLRRTAHRRKSPERTLHSDRMYVRHRHKRRNSDDSVNEAFNQKPKSKVAVVIKTQKKPAVASTIWSRVQRQSDSESSSESDSSKSEETSSSEESDSNSEDDSSSSMRGTKRVERPGFREVSSRRFREKVDYRSPLKITMTNDHFKK